VALNWRVAAGHQTVRCRSSSGRPWLRIRGTRTPSATRGDSEGDPRIPTWQSKPITHSRKRPRRRPNAFLRTGSSIWLEPRTYSIASINSPETAKKLVPGLCRRSAQPAVRSYFGIDTLWTSVQVNDW